MAEANAWRASAISCHGLRALKPVERSRHGVGACHGAIAHCRVRDNRNVFRSAITKEAIERRVEAVADLVEVPFAVAPSFTHDVAGAPLREDEALVGIRPEPHRRIKLEPRDTVRRRSAADRKSTRLNSSH